MKACSSVKDLLDRLSTETNIVEIVGDLSDLIRTDESLRQNGTWYNDNINPRSGP